MRQHALLAAALLLGLCLGCSSDDPTEPPAPPPSDTVLDEATVGAAGDTLSGDGAQVGIPAGALDDEVDLVLLREEEPSLGGETEAYRLEGLPADFGEPLSIRLPLPAGDKNGGNSAVHALFTGVPAPGDTSYHLATLPAEALGDTLVATLPPGHYVLALEDDGKDIGGVLVDLVLTGTRTMGSSSSQIPLPIFVEGDERILFYRDLLLQWLIEDAERFMPLTEGFRQTKYPRAPAYMPLIEGKVLFSRIEYSRMKCYLQQDGSDTEPVYPQVILDYSPEGSTDLDELRRQLNFLLWRSVYEARTALPVDWWLYATLYTLQLDVHDEIAPAIDAYRPLMLRGITRVVEQEPDPWTSGLAPYGYSMIDFALWIDRHEGTGWGRDALGATVNERAGYGYADVKHLDDALPDGPASWWPAFLADELTGAVRPIDIDLFTARIEETWTIDDANDRTHTFGGEQVCLDANLYRIALERDDFAENDVLRLTVSDPRAATTLVVFAADDTGWQEIDRGATVNIERLDLHAALDEDLMVLTANWDVENDAESRRDIGVSALLTDDTPIPDITTFDEISIQVTTDNTYSNGLQHLNEHLHLNSDMAWNGAGFAWAYEDWEGHADTVSVVVDPETLALGDWYAASFFETVGGNDHFIRLAGAGAGIPVVEWGTDDWGTQFVRWTLYGDDEVCDRLGAVYKEVWYSDALDHWLTGYACHDNGVAYDTSAISVLILKRAK